ncbi:hypothetical protein [Algoriphagus halophytocola]|uniref:Bifunctional isocitrate dehydrogenase kinase/phosphatase n=2 Tax=Algoriphagus halophytocola TaxID=2991499 RepID=A0ABY6MKR7_9BACT|nr:hypothetical protein [Algoriphagus sp. TR-M5]UZD23695.1 hypothetical protein OM944_04195 [Algoriphagus sp. TR-M5]
MFTSCGSDESTEEESSESFATNEAELNRNRAEIDRGLFQKGEWRAHWQEKVGEFDASTFELAMTDSLDPMEMPERNPILKGDPLFPYQFPHPSGNGTVDIYSYKIEAQENIDTPFLNPDSEVVWYRGDGMRERLLFMGPSGMFEEGMWLNDNEFLVLGYFEGVDGYRPMAWIIDVENHVLKQFQLNKSAEIYEHASYIDKKINRLDLS